MEIVEIRQWCFDKAMQASPEKERFITIDEAIETAKKIEKYITNTP